MLLHAGPMPLGLAPLYPWWRTLAIKVDQCVPGKGTVERLACQSDAWSLQEFVFIFLETTDVEAKFQGQVPIPRTRLDSCITGGDRVRLIKGPGRTPAGKRDVKPDAK